MLRVTNSLIACSSFIVCGYLCWIALCAFSRCVWEVGKWHALPMDGRFAPALASALHHSTRLAAARTAAFAAVDVFAHEIDLAAGRAGKCDVVSFPVFFRLQVLG